MRYALTAFNRVVLDEAAGDSAAKLLRQAIHDYVTVTLEFGIDAIEDVFELHHGVSATAALEPPAPPAIEPPGTL